MEVVIANEPKNEDPFFVILCDKTLHRCEATFKDGWGNMWYEGDMIINGVWYQKMAT